MSINQDDDEYYLTLPSNVSGSNNTISSWTTTLPSTLQLQGQWECGLAEIIYTNSAYTIPDPLPFEIHFQNGKVDHYYVPEGNYDSPAKLVSTLSSVLNSKPPVKRRKRDNAGAKPKEDELLEEDVEGALKPVQVEQKPAGAKPKEDELLEEDVEGGLKPVQVEQKPEGNQPKEYELLEEDVEGDLQPVKTEQRPTGKETREDTLLEEDVEGELKPVQVEQEPAVTLAPPQSTPPTESPPTAPPVPKPDKKDDKKPDKKDDKKPDKKDDKKPDKKDDKKPDKKDEKENNSPSSFNVMPKPTTSADPVTVTTVKPPTATTLPPIKEENEDELLEADDDQTLQVVSVEYPPAHVPATVTVQGEKFQGSTMQIPSDTQVVYNSWGRNEPIPPKRKPHKRTEMTILKLPKLAPPVMAENRVGVIKMIEVPQQPAGGGGILAEDENSPTKQEDTEMLEEDEDGSLDPVEEVVDTGPTPVAFVYDEFSNRIRVEVNSARVSSVHLSKGLMFLLGFEEPNIKSTKLSKYSPTTQAGSNALYIFSDIAAYSILGDTTSNQLRIVPVIGAYGTTCNAVFNPVRYFGCRTGMINSIQIDIRNEYGELIKFHYGTAVIVLHLRKKRH